MANYLRALKIQINTQHNICHKYPVSTQARGQEGEPALQSRAYSKGITRQLLGNSQHCKICSLPEDPKGFVCFQPYLLSYSKSSQWKLLLGLCWNTAVLRRLEEFAGEWFSQRAKKLCCICPSLICYVRKTWKWVIANNPRGFPKQALTAAQHGCGMPKAPLVSCYRFLM